MKKYVLAGTESRGSSSYVKPLTELYGDCAKLCGLYDANRRRAETVAKINRV